MRFAAALRDAGAELRLPRSGAPSAALALGGAGVSLFDLAALYSDLADGGAVGIPHTGEEGLPRGQALVSRHAAEVVGAILRDQPPPPGVIAGPGHPIAYKTGTSYGFHDAWACGFTPDYTVVVWVGRRDGSSRPGATGRDVAAFDPDTPIDLRAIGGTPPYSWTADGIPLPSEPSWGSPAWTATGPGFAHLTVTDQDGTSASADVRLVAD